jgi:phage shock protein A
MVRNEKDNLKALLNYWIAHNQDHSIEFREWAEKAKTMGEQQVAADILEAVAEMEKATALFSKSLKSLGVEGK